MMTNKSQLLALRNFGVAFGDRVVLSDVNFQIDGPGMAVLMGPVATGKSTLLRSIAGLNAEVGLFRSWGECSYDGEPIRAGFGPALVGQKARLMVSSVLDNILSDLPGRNTESTQSNREAAKRILYEAGLACLIESLDNQVVNIPLAIQRHLAVARTLLAEPKLLCVDEPTANIERADAIPILDFLKAQSKKRGVLVVSHNQQDARHLGGKTALLAGGTMQACMPTEAFFGDAAPAVVADFVRTGSCSLPSPGVRPEDLDESLPRVLPVLPEIMKNHLPDSLGPRGFRWLVNGVLAGTPRPGIVQDIEYDLGLLKKIGITNLISLTTERVDLEALARHGIVGHWMPILDMCAPELDAAEIVCRQVAELIAQGRVVAYHCRAGFGRTGTMLASQLIWEGQSPHSALEFARRIEPRWIQSDAQVKFLTQFSEFVSDRRKNMGRKAELV